jgi:hypothetical protein
MIGFGINVKGQEELIDQVGYELATKKVKTATLHVSKSGLVPVLWSNRVRLRTTNSILDIEVMKEYIKIK